MKGAREFLKAPVKIALGAVGIVKVFATESKDAIGSVASSETAQKSKKFLKAPGKFILGTAGVGITLAARIAWGLLKFAAKIIEKKGQVGFKEGIKIGEDMFDFDKKKEK